MKDLSKKFESLTEFSAWLNATPACGYFKKYNFEKSRAESDYRTEFTGTKSYQAADSLLLGGWHDGAARVKAAMVKSTSATSDRARMTCSVVGFAPNVARYVQGHPLNMYNKKRVKVSARVVDIVYNCAVSASVPAGNIELAAAKLFNVVAGLERGGVRVNLWVMAADTCNGQNASLAVRVKSANQPFNMLKMVYPCVHPSFIRRHVFAFIERAGVTGKKGTCSGYGRVVTDKEEVSKIVANFGISDKNIFDYYQLSGMSEREIADAIK